MNMQCPSAPTRHTSTIAKTVLFCVAVLLAAMGAGVLLGYYVSTLRLGGIQQVFTPPFEGKRTIRILLLGEDNTGRTPSKPRGLSDTIILASVDFDTKWIAALSIPRDTMVDLYAHGQGKINAAHVFGGPALTAMVVEDLVGIRPDYYIKIDLQGLKDCVDALGGVEIDVEKDMRYTDRRGGLYINLKKGRQVLDGNKAIQYVRFRHDALGDITRMQRQQRFIKACIAKAFEPTNLPKLPHLVQTVMKNVETDICAKDLLYLAKSFSDADLSRVNCETLPGEPRNIHGISYWIPDTVKMQEVVQALFYPPPTAFLPKVEVLNGSGREGAAERLAELLRKQGYEVTAVGNADSFRYRSSQIIAHKVSNEQAGEIARLMNVGRVRHTEQPNSRADVTIIIGRDWTDNNPGS